MVIELLVSCFFTVSFGDPNRRHVINDPLHKSVYSGLLPAALVYFRSWWDWLISSLPVICCTKLTFSGTDGDRSGREWLTPCSRLNVVNMHVEFVITGNDFCLSS